MFNFIQQTCIGKTTKYDHVNTKTHSCFNRHCPGKHWLPQRHQRKCLETSGIKREYMILHFNICTYVWTLQDY